MKTLVRIAIVLVILVVLGRNISGPRYLTTFAMPTGQSIEVTRDIAYGEHERQKLDLYRPEGDGPHPVVIFVHGGSWNRGHKNGYAFAGERFAAAGYLTAVINYRLVPEVTYPDFVTDTSSAIAFVYQHAAEYGGNPEWIFTIGHSAGAYNVVQSTLAPETWPEGTTPAVIDGVVGLAGPYDFLPLGRDSTKAAFGAADDLSATQPINRVTAGLPPMLLVYGEKDRSVKPRNIVEMTKAMEAAGADVEAIRYPNANHAALVVGLAFPAYTDVLEDSLAFFDRVMTEYTPDGSRIDK